MPKFINLSGKTFNYLTAIRPSAKKSKGSTYWECLCVCGKITHVQSPRLRSGRISSCGCMRSETTKRKITKHGHYKCNVASPEMSTWRAMINRCENIKSETFNRYGARGITVCFRWKKFSNFFADMGKRPNGKTLERINNKLGYSPSNCRWATPKEQSQNMRNSRKVAIGDSVMTIRQASDFFSIDYHNLRNRLNRHGEFNHQGKVIKLIPRPTRH